MRPKWSDHPPRTCQGPKIEIAVRLTFTPSVPRKDRAAFKASVIAAAS